MNKGKASVVYIHPGTVTGLFHDSLIQLLVWDHSHQRRVLSGGGIISMSSGPRIASARNQITRAFLGDKAQPEWMWMVDSDMTFHPDTLDRLIKAANQTEAKILGGLCFGGGRGGNVFPTLYRLKPPGDDGKTVEIIEDYPEDAVVKVDATGAACLLIHRTALETIEAHFGPDGPAPSPAPWFMETFYNGREFGEDWTFCMRAQQLGIDVFVHTGIKLGHVKPNILDEEAFAQYRAKRAELGSDQAVALEYRKRAIGV